MCLGDKVIKKMYSQTGTEIASLILRKKLICNRDRTWEPLCRRGENIDLSNAQVEKPDTLCLK